MADVRSLAQRAEEIHDRYRREFAGRSRITRSLTLLDQLIASMEGLLGEASAVEGAADSLVPTVRERLELYRTERAAIAEVQAGGPAEVTAHRVSEWSWLNSQRYRRCFAGQSRLTRDLGMLEEMRDEQRRWRDQLVQAGRGQAPGWRSELLAQLQRDHEMYAAEAEAIKTARASQSLDNRARTLATLANNQFTLWREHFAQQSRHTRRAALCRRMVGQLEAILADMKAVRDQGFRADFHMGNLSKVAERLDTWRSELRQIEQAAGQAGPASIASGLAEDANKQFQRYRDTFAGKSRADVDPAALDAICERLHEIARTMETLDQTWGLEVNRNNLNVVLENLKMYEREYARVREAQAPAPA